MTGAVANALLAAAFFAVTTAFRHRSDLLGEVLALALMAVATIALTRSETVTR